MEKATNEILASSENSMVDMVSDLLEVARKSLELSGFDMYRVNDYGITVCASDEEAEELEDDEAGKIRVSNFVPVVISNVVDVSTIGESHRIELVGIRDGMLLKSVILNENEFSNEKWILKHWGYGCIIHCSYGDIRKIIKAMASVSTCETAIYNYLGWEVNTNTKRYLLPDGVIVSSEHPVPDKRNISFSKNLRGHSFARKKDATDTECDDYIFKSLLEVAEHHVTYTALAFALLSLIKSLFEDWTFKPDFVYVLLGKSSSMKTSLAKLFFNLYSKFIENVPINFQATLAAMEKFYTEFRDAPLLIDDICPVMDKTEKRRRDERFEKLIRAAGDSVARQKIKNGAENELKMSCLLCFTGEDIPTNTPSTLARLFIANLSRKNVNKEKLTSAQSKRSLYTTFITRYIAYICGRSDYLAHFKALFIKNRNYFERNQNQHIHGRFLNTNAWLMASFEMFLHYEVKKGYLDEKTRNKMNNEFSRILLDLTNEQERLTQDNDIIRLFVDAFNQMLFSQQMMVSEIGNAGKKICTLQPAKRCNIGYYDGVYYYFLPHLLYEKVCAFYNSGSTVFPWTQRELINSLKNAGILLTDNSEANTIKKTIDGTSMRVLRLDVAKIENFYSEME